MLFSFVHKVQKLYLKGELMKKHEHTGRPKNCGSTPGERSCKKRQKHTIKRKNGLCKCCQVKDIHGKRISIA